MTSAQAEAGRSGRPGAGEVSVVSSIRGLPWWGGVLLAALLTAAGTTVDVLDSGTVGIAYGVGLAAGCLLAVAWVRRRELFAPMVQPPLLVAVIVPAVVAATGSLPSTGGTVSLVLAVGGPFINGFPAMAVTTVACLAFGWARTRLQPWTRVSPAERTATPRRAAGLDRPGGGRGGDRPGAGRGTDERDRTDRDRTDRDGDTEPDDVHRTERLPELDTDAEPRSAVRSDLRTDRLEPDRRERGRASRPERPAVRTAAERVPEGPPGPPPQPAGRPDRAAVPGAGRRPPPPQQPEDQPARRSPLAVPGADAADPPDRRGPVPTGRSEREDEARRRIREQRLREQRMRSERRREREGREGPAREEREPRRDGPVPPN